MEAPKCKLCGERHALSESHVFKLEPKSEPVKIRVEKVEKAKFSMEKSTVLGTLKHCRTCRCFPMTAAERQKAYRERHKAK